MNSELGFTENKSTEKALPNQPDLAVNETQTHDEVNKQQVASSKETKTELQEQKLEFVSTNELLNEMERIVNLKEIYREQKLFGQIKNKLSSCIQDESELKKSEFVKQGNLAEDFSWTHPIQSKFNTLVSIFKEKYDELQKKTQNQQQQNLETRKAIIDKLKSLYINPSTDSNLFKEIRNIKKEWNEAGQVDKNHYKLLSNDYFHHLNQFYSLLDLNKEFLQQEFAHNLEKRHHIIQRAEELLKEPVQKALNELQYLHKLWKEEAEPVAEEFREMTWEAFKSLSNKIHDRKSELSEVMEQEQKNNLQKKNTILAELEAILSKIDTYQHQTWQSTIKKTEELKQEFLKTGSVPKAVSNENWNSFKQKMKLFNTAKNQYYKSIKNTYTTNLEAKLKLIEIASANKTSEDWETMLTLYKKLQEDWKNIGHVPRNMADKIWKDFREHCNYFFENYREKNKEQNDNWKENYQNKRAILDQLKEVVEDETGVQKIEELKSQWNAIGKVNRDKIGINQEFNKVLKEKLKLNNISEFDLTEENLSKSQITDKARKIKNQMSELETEIVKLETNLGFFSKPSRENPMLKDSYDKIDAKKIQLEQLKQNFHQIVSGEQ